ncbi:hypothetical protein Tco_0938722 [Tanacetum coccineum]|uniref:Synaptobrevin, longin-like domain protein n=1 Tax=Tanacetum coccineum TaxID=301880 RepID=A0ABQ5DIV4_9ASTR
MADLKFVDQHNMVACLEKTEENAEFHQIVDFLSTCSINYALTVSPTIYASYIEQFWNTATSKTVNSVKQIHAIVDGKAVVISESSVRSDLLFNDEDGIACLTNDEIFENLALMGYEQLSTKLTFQKGSFSPQWKFLIHTILHCISSKSTAWNEFSTNLASAVICLAKGQKFNFSKLIFDGMLRNLDPKKFLMYPRSERVLEKPNEPRLLEGHTSGSREGGMEHTFELMDTVLPTSYDSPLTGGYTPGSDEGRLKLKELMAICTKLSKQVLDLEKEKDAQDVEILKLKQRVKKLDRKRKLSISHPRRRIYRQVNDFDVLDDDMEDVEGETVHTATTGVSVVSAPVTTAGVAISTAEHRTPSTTAATAFMDEDLTIAQTFIKMKEEKAKEKGVAIKDVEYSLRPIRSIITLQPLPTIDPKDRELAHRLHEEELAELDKALKERQKQEEATSAALAKRFDEIQARIDVDHELAIRLTHEEQEKYTIEERARLLAKFFERRKKQLAAERAKAIRNKPPTRTQKLYEKEKKWIDDFKPIDDDSQQQAESTKKRPRADSKEESSKKQKLEEDNDAEKEELRDNMDVVPRGDVAIDVESLATKYPIFDWKTHILNENMMYYQIIRADGSSKNYKIFSEMLDDFDRQDVIDLHRMVNERYETKIPEGYDLLL